MEAVRESQPVIPVPQKLTIEKFADGGITCLKFAGTIDEAFEGKKLARTVQGDTLVLDLGGVKKISSFGIREWVDFIGTASKQVKTTLLIECAPKVIDQLNMVANFAGSGRVFSFYAPFRCDYCDSEQRVLLDVNKDAEAIKAMKLADRPCPSCKESMYFDEDGSTYFSYVAGQGPLELPPDVVTFLAAKLDYRVGTVDSKLHVDKAIEGRLTYLRLTGDLNNTFPRDKLAEGLEGTVVVDLTLVPRVEPAGAAEWRGFVTQIAPLVEQVVLVGVQPPVLEKLCGRDDLGAKTVVLDLLLPYACASCGTSSAQSINVAEHHEVLTFATAPEERCPSCKAAMQCTATEQTMTMLPHLPKPALAGDVVRQIGMLKARKLDKKPAVAQAPSAAPVAAPSSKAVPILLAALLLVLVVGGAVYFLKQPKDRGPGPYGAGPVVERSASTRPAWIPATAALGGTTCQTEGGGIACVGVSTLSPSQEDAEDEASDAAVEAIVLELGNRTPEKALAPLYTSVRESKLAALARDPQSTQARREVRDARQAVARSLRSTGAIDATHLAERYWESFSAREGRRVVAFVRVTLPAADVKRLTTLYATRSSAEGATVVGFFPALAWRFSRLEHGAVVVELTPGVIQELGISEHSVVLGIDGREVTDAGSFAQILGEERSLLAEHGGALRLRVQVDAGDPREFSKMISAPAQPAGTGSAGKPNGGTPGTPATGPINVWDRYNGAPRRDDPSQ